MKRELIVNDIFFNEYKKGESGKIDGKRTIRYSGPGEKDLYKISGTRGWRNNNPGNIVCGPYAKKSGAIGCDGIIAIYPDYESGKKAIRNRITTGGWEEKTIREVIQTWAPKEGGNPTEKYIEYVVDKSGLYEDTKVKNMRGKDVDMIVESIVNFEKSGSGKELTGVDSPGFAPGKFQSKIDSGSSRERFAKSKSSLTGESRTDKKIRPSKSRARKSGGCKETLVREGKRVIRKEADCGTRGSFIS